MSKKLFIVIEGIDCAGKSTQAELLKNYFANQTEQAVISSEPSNGIIGNLIRQALKQRIIFSEDKVLFDEQMVLDTTFLPLLIIVQLINLTLLVSSMNDFLTRT